MAASISKSQFDPLGNIKFTQNFQTKALRNTGNQKRAELQAIRSNDLKLTPQKLGDYASRSRMTDQSNKTVQSRFKDFFA